MGWFLVGMEIPFIMHIYTVTRKEIKSSNLEITNESYNQLRGNIIASDFVTEAFSLTV